MYKDLINKIKFELEFNNTRYFTRITEKLVKTFYQKLLKRKLSSLSSITLNKETANLTLAILANKKRFYESVAAIYSFCFWNRDIFVHYYEDGTLSHDEIGFLKKTFPGIKVFRRADQNIEVKKYLLSKGFNYCAQLRDHFLFAIRSFDMIIEKKTSFLLQIDSDVLFFSKPNEILEMVFDGNLNGCYNQDVANAYSFDNATIYKYISMPVINNFNAGLFLHNFNESFFNSAEDILAQEPDAFTSWHLEQTLFAMYATVRGKFLGLPKQYDVCRRERNLGNKVVSEHYTHNTGYDFHKDFIYKLYPKYNK